MEQVHCPMSHIMAHRHFDTLLLLLLAQEHYYNLYLFVNKPSLYFQQNYPYSKHFCLFFLG